MPARPCMDSLPKSEKFDFIQLKGNGNIIFYFSFERTFETVY
jgi:hypothetical protein